MSIFSPHSHSSFRQAFTLVELLIVVAIIGVLAAVSLTGLSAARAKARDAQRLKDLDTIQGAVELYYRDYGHYPITTNPFCMPGGSWVTFDSMGSPYAANKTLNPSGSGCSPVRDALAPYLPSTMKDPRPGSNSSAGYFYKSDPTGARYYIAIWYSPENMNDFPSIYVTMTGGTLNCTAIGSNGQCSGSNNLCYTSAGATGGGNKYYVC